MLLPNVLCATTPCTFQHLNFQKRSDPEVLCAFSLRNRLRATTACNFSSLISPDVSAPAALASLLFNPPEPQNHEKTQCFATFLPFRAPASSFFWSFLFCLFSLLTAFSSLHIVGSLTSKLPSINYRIPAPSLSTSTSPPPPGTSTLTLTPNPHAPPPPTIRILQPNPDDPPRDPPFRPWTNSDDQELMSMKQDTKSRPSWKTIGARLHRDPQVCKLRWEILKQTDQHGRVHPPHKPEAED